VIFVLGDFGRRIVLNKNPNSHWPAFSCATEF